MGPRYTGDVCRGTSQTDYFRCWSYNRIQHLCLKLSEKNKVTRVNKGCDYTTIINRPICHVSKFTLPGYAFATPVQLKHPIPNGMGCWKRRAPELSDFNFQIPYWVRAQ